jgi:hypothetical protein
MTSFRVELGGPKKKPHEEFTEKEKKALFHFLDKNNDEEQALDFAKRWFNCTQFTLMMLIMEHIE